MDRTSELVTDYEKMQQIYERFQERQALKVEGEWILCEHLGRETSVLNLQSISDNLTLSSRKEEDGWTITPVTIFRKSE